MDTVDRMISVFESPLLDFAIKGVLIYLAVLWLASVVWVARDIINRSNSVILQVSFILMNILLPVFGLALYLIVRPSKTLLEKYYEELEYGFLSEQSTQDESCPRCDETLATDFLFCPSCSEQVKNSCKNCNHVYLSSYVVCPYCGRKERSKAAGVKPKAKKAKDQTKKKSAV